MNSVEQLVIKIQELFRVSLPNGIVLGWDENRYFSSLTELCTDCKVVNNTDFNYSNCNSFEIEQNDNPREDDYVITFKISFILDAYSIHITRYSKDRKRGEVILERECDELKPIIESIRCFAKKEDLQEIGCAEHDIVVRGISLELSEVATLGKCLFDDFE